MDSGQLNPLATIGLGKRGVRLLSRDLDTFRDFLNNYFRNIAKSIHPDTSGTTDQLSGEINAAFTQLRAMEDTELRRTITDYISGTDDELFGIRLELQSASTRISNLQETVENATNRAAHYEEVATNNVKKMAILFDKFLKARFFTPPEPDFYRPEDLHGWFFTNIPRRRFQSKPDRSGPNLIEQISVSLAHLQQNGLLVERDVFVDFEEPATNPIAREAIETKIRREIFPHPENFNWKPVGYLFGFASGDDWIRFPRNEALSTVEAFNYLIDTKLIQPSYKLLRPTRANCMDGLICLYPKNNGRYELRTFIVPTHQAIFRPTPPVDF